MKKSNDSKVTESGADVKNFPENSPEKPIDIDTIRKKKNAAKKEIDSADGYQETPPPKATFNTAKILLNTEFPPLKWIIEGILPEGLTLFAGKPKLGKSIFALNAAIAISTGSMAFEQLYVKQGRVLYCALEDSGRRLKDRLIKMLPHGNKNELLENLDFSTDFPNMDGGGCERLTEYIEKYSDIRLVIIDTWGKFKPAYRNDKASYDSDVNAVSKLKAIADKYRIAIMLIHHTRKMEATDAFDTISGTLGLTGSADTIAILSRGRGDKTGIVQITGRDVEETEIQMQFTPDILTWHILSENEKKKSETDMQNKIMNCLKESKIPLSIKDISDSEVLEYKYVKNQLFRWAIKGKVFKIGRGQYTLDDPKVSEGIKVSEVSDDKKPDTFDNSFETQD